MHRDKPFSQPCENNKAFILDQLSIYFADVHCVLEIGSGTGQHAVHFAPGLPHLIWQCSDQRQYHLGINQWIDDFPANNLRRPLEFTVGIDKWPEPDIDGVFSANTAHIMQKYEVQSLMQLVSDNLPAGGMFCQYGPFIQNGKFSSESNAQFHQKLIAEGYGGYRSLDELHSWAKQLNLENIIEMPANNLLLVWKKKS